jgi:hypothetical protein
LKPAEYLEFREQNHVFSGDTGDGTVFPRLAVGWAANLAANRVLSSELWGVNARDPLTFAAAALVGLTAGVAVGWFPARRATRVDPMIALRFEWTPGTNFITVY